MWEPRPGVLAALSSVDLSFAELADIVLGIREVDEREWNAWLATLPNGGGMSESEETSDSGTVTATTAPGSVAPVSIPPELAPFVEASDVPWFPPVQIGSLLGVVTSQVGDASCVALLTAQGRIDGGCAPPGNSYANYDVTAMATVWFGKTVAANASIHDVFGPGTTGWVGPIGADALRPYLATYVPPNEVPDEATSTNTQSGLQRLVEPGQQLWVAPVSSLSIVRVSPLDLATRPEGDAICSALLTVDARYEHGCSSTGGASYSNQEVPGIGTVWFGLAIPQAPTLAEAFGEDIVQWSGPPLPDGRRPVLGIRTSTG